MPEYTLRIRRFDPQSGDAPRWDEHTVDLPETQSVLDAILKIRDDVDGSVCIRCSCQQAICGSCGVRMNGKPGLACNTHLGVAAERTRLEDEVRLRAGELADAARRKDEFLAMLAHELRNPLSAIASAVHLARREPSPEQAKSLMAAGATWAGPRHLAPPA